MEMMKGENRYIKESYKDIAQKDCEGINFTQESQLSSCLPGLIFQKQTTAERPITSAFTLPAKLKPIEDWPRTLGQDEKAAQKIIRKVHPTVVSEQRRREDIDHVQRLIGNSLDSENIVVDVSFKQIGDLCTLCCLEKVDLLIGKDHLFKCSIILIKAWCYYESRIIVAHHGLITTYALETMVLYIFHLFHSTLNVPLALLYKYLDYVSKFDRENYCISLNGPVHISSLPAIVAETRM
ncbi:Uncharacterized protein Fot_40050 [Forsythia ovata]|uniref:PAP/OAS1 substrate-binding-related domain-containing protein n=1 Tax=Forsythia ovata TaxID=205694 RepID=A0ABD1S6C6_9LAMI